MFDINSSILRHEPFFLILSIAKSHGRFSLAKSRTVVLHSLPKSPFHGLKSVFNILLSVHEDDGCVFKLLATAVFSQTDQPAMDTTALGGHLCGRRFVFQLNHHNARSAIYEREPPQMRRRANAARTPYCAVPDVSQARPGEDASCIRMTTRTCCTLNKQTVSRKLSLCGLADASKMMEPGTFNDRLIFDFFFLICAP
jgi:hypothetical protein